MSRLSEAVDRAEKATLVAQRVLVTRPLEDDLQPQVAEYFVAQGRAFVKELAQYRYAFEAVRKRREAIEVYDWLTAFELATASTNNLLTEPLDKAIRSAVIGGGNLAIQRMGISNVQMLNSIRKESAEDFKFGYAFNLKISPAALQYIENHGAEAVTQITETTRQAMNALLQQSAIEGWSYSHTARVIREQFEGFAGLKPQLHIRNRAELVAVTEIGNAYCEGGLQAAYDLQAAGVKVVKSWMTTGDNRVSEGCQENEGADWIALEDEFPSGHQRPLRFPGCRCDLLTEVR